MRIHVATVLLQKKNEGLYIKIPSIVANDLKLQAHEEVEMCITEDQRFAFILPEKKTPEESPEVFQFS